MFHNRIVARYEAETAATRDDASSSQVVDATQIYLNQFGGVKKKLVYDLRSTESLCLRSHVSSNFINMPSTNQLV